MTQAQIYDRGYRRYDGIRTGRPGALSALVRFSVRSTFGFGRSFFHKIIPFGLLGMAFVPAFIFIGICLLYTSDAADD